MDVLSKYPRNNDLKPLDRLCYFLSGFILATWIIVVVEWLL